MISRIGYGIGLFLSIISYAIILRSVLSWFLSPYNRFMQYIIMMTEPFILPARAIIAKLFGESMMGFDFSPLLAFLMIRVLQRLVYIIF